MSDLNTFNYLAAIGGGMFGAMIGGTTAFIFAGIFGAVGIALALATGNTIIVDQIAFGPFFGPQVAFVGGVAAAAFAANRRNVWESGMDTIKPLYATKDIPTLIVAGIFGLIGYILNTIFAVELGWGFDTIALTVLSTGMLVRLIFGNSGLFGKFPQNEKRYALNGNNLVFNIILAFFLAALTSYAVDKTGHPSIGFVISATSLILLYFGFDSPVTHHITATAGTATALSGNIFIGILVGTIASIVFEFMARTFNTHADTHIDVPALTIAPLTLIVWLIYK